jgi:hypothetical protein
MGSIEEIPISDIVRRGDVVYGPEDLTAMDEMVTLYLGNGHLGGCFDYLGTMAVDGSPGSPEPVGDTYFCSLYHFVHGNYGMDYALPVARLRLSVRGVSGRVADAGRIGEYGQRLTLFEGLLKTRFRTDCGTLTEREQFFSQVRKNLFVCRNRCREGKDSILEIRIEPVVNTPFHYGQHFRGTAEFRRVDDLMLWTVRTGDTATTIGMALNGEGVREARSIENGVAVSLGNESDVTIWCSIVSDRESKDPLKEVEQLVGESREAGYDFVRKEHTDWWEEYWNESLISLPGPAEDCQKLWLRGNYYLACSLSDRETPHPPLVFGLARVGWPSYFPQDFLYLYQNTLSANHLRHAASTADFWFDILPHAREYARRMFDLPGAYYPWTPPLFIWDDYHKDGVPNDCYYEHHNGAYVARMVLDYARWTGDAEYRRERAYPVIREIAEMYRGMMSFDSGIGKHEIRFTPSKGQDEYAPSHQANYFDCLLSAEYTLRVACDMARKLNLDGDLRREWSEILRAGLAWEKLRSGDRYLAYEGDDRGGRSEKHPVQLNPIALLGVRGLRQDVRISYAYRDRYLITLGYDRDEAHAWTLGEFLLASARMGDADGFREDLRRARSCRIVDPRLIQTFESSGSKPHFMTTQGFFMEAITECFVQCRGGVVEVGQLILPEWREASRREPIRFHNLRAPGGFLVSGVISGEEEEYRIFSERGEKLSLGFPWHWEKGSLIEESGEWATQNGGALFIGTPEAGATLKLIRGTAVSPPEGSE